MHAARQARVCAGSAARSVQSSACGSKPPAGRGPAPADGHGRQAGVVPHRRAEATSTVRAPSPYQLATVTLVQAVVRSARRAARVGRRWPFLRGRPICARAAPARQGGVEPHRVTTAMGLARRAQRASARSPRSAIGDDDERAARKPAPQE
ncbi:MAG: hypothetical protein U0232_14985 [Thermomicrobiales bacterium]